MKLAFTWATYDSLLMGNLENFFGHNVRPYNRSNKSWIFKSLAILDNQLASNCKIGREAVELCQT